MKRVAVAVLLLALLGVAACGEATETPAIVGGYILDEEATHAAQSAAADRWGAEPGHPYRGMAEKTARGENEIELAMSADGTWTCEFTIDGRTRASRGTWALEGDDLRIAEVPPQEGQQQFSFHYRDGVIQLLDYNDAPYWVLRRTGGP